VNGSRGERQHHVEGVGPGDPGRGEHIAFLAPVDLRLRAGDHLEAAVQAAQAAVLAVSGELVGDHRPDLRQVHLDPLVVAGEAMISDESFVDHAGSQRDVHAQPRLDQRDERGDHLRLRSRPGGRGRRPDQAVGGQVLAHGAPVDIALECDLGVGRAGFVQHTETTDVHPGPRIQDHERGHPSGSSTWRWTNRRVTSTRARRVSTRRRPTYTSGRTPTDT